MAKTVNTTIRRRVDTSANWTSNNPVLKDREEGLDKTVMRSKVGDGVTAWNSLPYWNPSYTPPAPVLQTVNSGEAALYNLSAPQLAAVNAFGRIPNFVALIGGQQYFDIYPTYAGDPGSYTLVQVALHNDGSGNNLDTTTFQFS